MSSGTKAAPTNPGRVLRLALLAWGLGDLAMGRRTAGIAWLIAEIVDAYDHGSDTVTKKMIYEESRLPRLWMIDPRYDNVEVYHGTPYGLSLKEMLAGKEVLTEKLLPEFQMVARELFG